jgi:hypothetical protein
MGNMEIHKLESSSNLSSKTKNKILSVYVQRIKSLNPVINIMQHTPNFHAFMFTSIGLFSVVNLRGLSMKLIAQSYVISSWAE